jgi:hypothetical protein
VLSTVLIGLLSIAIAGYLTLGENPRAVAMLRWLYRWRCSFRSLSPDRSCGPSSPRTEC